ncbi:MAG: HRDC domain-containing protein, partial [Planctomycetota bacterium]
SFVRIKGARTLSPKGRSALRELNVERDALAHEGDVPPFRIVNNPALLAIAEKRPRDRRGLTAIHGFSDRQASRFGERFLDALARAEENGPLDKLPRLPAKDGTTGFSDEEVEFHERLKLWRKKRAEEMGFDASLLVNRHALLRLARAKLRSQDDLEKIEGLAEWQLERFGEELVRLRRDFESDLKSGKIDLSKKRRRR